MRRTRPIHTVVCTMLMTLVIGCGDKGMHTRVAALDDATLAGLADNYPADSKPALLIREELERRGIPSSPPAKDNVSANQKPTGTAEASGSQTNIVLKDQAALKQKGKAPAPQETTSEKTHTEGIFTFKAPANLRKIQGPRAESLKSQMIQGGRELAEASGSADPNLFTESSLTFFAAYELGAGDSIFALVGDKLPVEMNRDEMFNTNSKRIQWGRNAGQLSSDSKGVSKLDIDGIPTLLMDIVSPNGERLQTYTFFVPNLPRHSFAITFKSPKGEDQKTIDDILKSLKIARAKASGLAASDEPETAPHGEHEGPGFGQSFNVIKGVSGESYMLDGYSAYVEGRSGAFAPDAVLIVGVNEGVDFDGVHFGLGAIIVLEGTSARPTSRLATSSDRIVLTRDVEVFGKSYDKGGFTVPSGGHLPPSRVAAQQAHAAQEQTQTPEVANGLVRLVGEVSTLESFYYESDDPVGVRRPERQARAGMKLVTVKANLYIPRGWSWDLSTTQLGTDASTRYALLALKFGDNLHILAAEGGHAMVNEGGELSQIQIVGIPSKANHLGFVGKEWPGDRHEFELVFEVPAAQSPKSLWSHESRCDIPRRRANR